MVIRHLPVDKAGHQFADNCQIPALETKSATTSTTIIENDILRPVSG